ncbi:hypothetical protein, partial [Streptomyces sp. NPDC015350]|uniref:hypothetical protein n=1 Tax=Streptomyces sp. NPDC015350 TaxID=3364955 RepID=UPI0036F95534
DRLQSGRLVRVVAAHLGNHAHRTTAELKRVTGRVLSALGRLPREEGLAGSPAFAGDPDWFSSRQASGRSSMSAVRVERGEGRSGLRGAVLRLGSPIT